jgi:hypothetical protein
VDSYTRRTTRAFSFIWSAFALGLVTVAILLGVTTEPAPDFFIIVFGVTSAFASGVCGFFHGVTLSAARRLDEHNLAQSDEENGEGEYVG